MRYQELPYRGYISNRLPVSYRVSDCYICSIRLSISGDISDQYDRADWLVSSEDWQVTVTWSLVTCLALAPVCNWNLTVISEGEGGQTWHDVTGPNSQHGQPRSLNDVFVFMFGNSLGTIFTIINNPHSPHWLLAVIPLSPRRPPGRRTEGVDVGELHPLGGRGVALHAAPGLGGRASVSARGNGQRRRGDLGSEGGGEVQRPQGQSRGPQRAGELKCHTNCHYTGLGGRHGWTERQIYVLTWTILATKLYKLDICLNLWAACWKIWVSK